MNFLDKWNKAKFNVYDSEEKTILKLISKISNFIGELAKGLDDKTDLNGDHKGSWQGINKPTLSDEGMRGTVEKINDVDIPSINTNILDINNELTNVKEDINIINENSLNIMNMIGTTKEEKFINALKYAYENNYKRIYVPCGEYNFKNITSDTIVLPLSHYQIIIEGENTRGVVFNYSESHIDKVFMKFKGHSGTIAQSYIKNITFYGNNTTTGLELNNTCGFRVENCNFENNKVGLLFHNTEDGFTELCVADYSNFASSCLTAVYYKKDGTQTSFHGTGLMNCYINQNENNYGIYIDNGCFPYNAPLDFRAWTRGVKPLIVNSGSAVTNFYGNMTIESFNNSTVDLVYPTGFPIYYNGTLTTNSEKIRALQLELCSRIQLNSDYSINVVKLQQNNAKYCTSSTPIAELKDCETSIIDIHLTYANYEIQHTLLITTFVGGSGGNITYLAKHREFDNSNLGLPSYRLEGNILWIDNSKYNGSNVVAQYTINQIGSRTQYHII